MKKIKYLIVILVICILVFIGIEVFRKAEQEVENNRTNNITENENITIGANVGESTVAENITVSYFGKSLISKK